MAIWPIFDVCAREIGYKGGGRLRVLYWSQKAAEKQLRVTVEAILVAARVRRRQESGRHYGSEIELKGVIMDSIG